MVCSPLGSLVHEIFQARILEWVAIPFSRGSSQPRDQTKVSCTEGRFFTILATREANIGRKQLTNILLIFSGSMEGVIFSSVQFSRSVMSDSLQPHQLQHLFLLTQGQALQSFPTQSFRNPLPIYSKFMPQWSLFVISDKIDPFFNDERDYQNLQSQQHCIMQFCILCKFPNELVSQWERLLVRGDTEYRMSNYLQLENSRGQECSSIGKLCNCNWHSASIVSLSRKIWYKGFRQFKKI